MGLINGEAISFSYILSSLSISLIVPVHKEQDQKILSTCLSSIIKATPPPFEFILVSDGQKVTLDRNIQSHIRVKELQTNQRLGPAYARNLGAKTASGDLLCFIDSDIAIPKNLFQKIKAEFNADSNLTALFGSYDKYPSEPGFLSQYRNLLHHFVHQNSNEKASTFWSGCGVIRKSVFLDIGGFDFKKYPIPSIEDIELGYRLTNQGYAIKLCKKIQVKHLKKWGLKSMLKVDFFHRALPWTELLLKKEGYTNDLNLKLKDRLSVIVIFLFIPISLMAFFAPTCYFIPLSLFAIFILLNHKLYFFYYQQKGWPFMLKVIPWQGVFYLSSGLAYILGNINFYLKNKNE